MIFDVNDLDETLPGPWEWDVKRGAASLANGFHNDGERVVVGQRLMQSASRHLPRLGPHARIDGVERDFYVRQLWDWKGSLDLERVIP
jgi:uncharacterized protein (DUF2252 family)